MGKRKMIHSEKALPGEWRRPCCRSAPFFPTAKAKHSFYSAKEKTCPTEKAKYFFKCKRKALLTAKAKRSFNCKRKTIVLSNCKSKISFQMQKKYTLPF